MILFENKKAMIGGEFMLWFFRIILLIIVVFGVVSIVSNFFLIQYDITDIEGKIIVNTLVECLLQNKLSVSKDTIYNLFDTCKINIEPEFIYINVTLFDTEVTSNYFGEKNFEVLCNTKIKQQYVSCTTEYVLVPEKYGKKNIGILKILVALSKLDKNV